MLYIDIKTSIMKSNEDKNKDYSEIPQLVDTSVFIRKYNPVIFQVIQFFLMIINYIYSLESACHFRRTI